MNRRSFIGIVVGAVAALTLRAAVHIDDKVDCRPDLGLPDEGLGKQISYLSRRSILSSAYTQIYNTSPLLTRFLE